MVLQKFDEFSHGAHKADLWRLCVLYIYGGCYLDADLALMKPIDDIIKDCKADFLVPLTEGFLFKRLFNALIITPPGNEHVKQCLLEILKIRDKDLKWYYLLILKVMQKTLGENFDYELKERRVASGYFNLTDAYFIFNHSGERVAIHNPTKQKCSAFEIPDLY